MFINKYRELFDNSFKYALKAPRRKTPKQEWITPGLIKSCRTKCKLYKQFVMNPTSINESIYKKFCNKLKSLLSKAESTYYIIN